MGRTGAVLAGLVAVLLLAGCDVPGGGAPSGLPRLKLTSGIAFTEAGVNGYGGSTTGSVTNIGPGDIDGPVRVAVSGNGPYEGWELALPGELKSLSYVDCPPLDEWESCDFHVYYGPFHPSTPASAIGTLDATATGAAGDTIRVFAVPAP